VEVVIFDLDGTLAYTASSHRKAWELALKDLGLQIPENLDDLLGRRTIEIAKQLGGEKYRELFQRKNQYYSMLIRTNIKPAPCAFQVFRTLRSRSLRIGVVTSSLRRSALDVLSILGLKPDILVAGDDVEKGKPDPEPVLTALKLLGSKPEESMGVGDTLTDVIAYRRAGVSVRVLVIGEVKVDLHEVKREDPEVRICESLCDLPVTFSH